MSSKGNILCRLIKIELYKIFAIINRAIKGLHCICEKIDRIIMAPHCFFSFRDRQRNTGMISCRVCLEDFQTGINYILEYLSSSLLEF